MSDEVVAGDEETVRSCDTDAGAGLISDRLDAFDEPLFEPNYSFVSAEMLFAGDRQDLVREAYLDSPRLGSELFLALHSSESCLSRCLCRSPSETPYKFDHSAGQLLRYGGVFDTGSYAFYASVSVKDPLKQLFSLVDARAEILFGDELVEGVLVE